MLNKACEGFVKGLGRDGEGVCEGVWAERSKGRPRHRPPPLFCLNRIGVRLKKRGKTPPPQHKRREKGEWPCSMRVRVCVIV